MVTESKSDLLSRLENAAGKEKMGILNQLAGLYWDLQPNERIAFAEQAVDLAKKLHDRRSRAESLNHLGIAHNNLGDSQRSIEYFLKALQIAEQIDDKNGIAISCRNLGQANFYLDSFDRALEYFLRALKLQEEIGNKKDISQSLLMVGNVKAKTAIYDEAEDYYLKAMSIKEEINDKHGISQIYNNLGNIYLDTGRDSRALEYRLRALQIDRELEDKWEIANSTYNIAEQYLINKEPEEAYPYIVESQELAEYLDNKGLIRDNLHNFSLYYELREDFQKALSYQREYSELTKGLFSEELSEKVAEMQAKYETAELEEAVAEKTQELQKKVVELGETETSLRKSEQRLDLAVTGTGLGLWTWDIRGDGFNCTPQWARMLGYSLGEIEPKFSSYRNLVHPDDEHIMIETLNAHLEGKTPIYEAEFRMHTKFGEWKWILSTGRVFERDNDGKPLMMTGLHRDVTERVQADKEIRRLNVELEQRVIDRTAKLEATNQELDAFAYVVSHDLRAPLRGISQLATWIATDYADTLDTSGQEMVHLLIGRVKRMHNLIEGILRYSRIGRVKEAEKRVNLNQLVRDTIDLLAPPEHVHIAVEDELPTVVGEQTRLEQVFQNLLDNAIKFMDKPAGQICVGCADEGTHWQFSVADNGPGIEKEYYDKVFQMFQTLAPRDEFESAGVGLALVKKIVETWGGRIWVQSTVGEGSTFYFTLPKARKAVSYSTA